MAEILKKSQVKMITVELEKKNESHHRSTCLEILIGMYV